MITKMNPEDLNSPCRELFTRGLGFIAALLVHWKIGFSTACIGRPIQL